MTDFIVRKMVRRDLELAYAWSIEEGWNIGRFDHDVFFATDPDGFFVGELNGEPVGSCSGVAYGDSYGFMGIYIVRPEHRGRGYGIQIFNAAMSYLGNRNIGLDGVIAQQENYKLSGFKYAYRNIRFHHKFEHISPPISENIVPAASVPFSQLADYDQRHFLIRRERFLAGWIAEPGATALVSMKDGAINGFAMVRQAVIGWSIAPLFADTVEVAETLFITLASKHAGEDIFLDVPEPNSAGVALAKTMGMNPIFETARMYTGATPDLPLSNIFGVTSFELG